MVLLIGVGLLAFLAPHHPPTLLVPRHPRRRIPVAAQEAPALELEFPLPLSPAQKLQRAASFWVRVLPVIGSYLRLYSEFQVRERVLGECLDEEQCEVLWEEEHDKGAAVLSRAINDLKVRARRRRRPHILSRSTRSCLRLRPCTHTHRARGRV